MFTKLKSFFGIGGKVIGDSEPIFKNLPFDVDRRVGINIIKIAAKSSYTVPDPIEVLDGLKNEYINKREGATVNAIKSFFTLLKNSIGEVNELRQIIPETIDVDVCLGGSKEKCLFDIFKLEGHWLKIEKQVSNIVRFMPELLKTQKKAIDILKKISSSVRNNRYKFKAYYLKIAKLANSDDYSSFAQFMEIKQVMEKQVNEVINHMLSLYQKEDYLTNKLYEMNGDITYQLAETELLRSYLTEDVKGVKLSDIIYLFKERVQEYKKRLNDKHKPTMPVIDELPELEGIEFDEIEEEKQMEDFKRELEKNKSLKEIQKNLKPTDSRGFFGKLVGVLTFGCGGN